MSEAVDKFVGKLDELATKYEEPVIANSISAARISGAQDLLYGAASLFVSMPTAYAAWFFLSLGNAAPKYAGEGWYVLGGAATLATAALLLAGLFSLANLWSWMALRNPKAYIAHKILGI